MRLKNFTLSLLLMAAPAVASATDYYVSPAGSGSKDGSSAENAWGITELKDKFTSDAAKTYANGDNFYFAPGKYLVDAGMLYVSMGVNLIGAEGAERTVFTGDVDGNAEANAGDRDRLFFIQTAIAHGNTAKCVSISNIDFEYFYPAIGKDEERGILYLDNCGALVTISKCNFKNFVNDGQYAQGGTCINSKRTNLKVVDCTFQNIKAKNRGVVARFRSDNAAKGWTTFERCLFANNEAFGAEGDPMGVLFLEHGQQLNLVNCTFANNKSSGRASSIFAFTDPDKDYKRKVNIVSCTFANNTSANGYDIMLNKGENTNAIVNTLVAGSIDPSSVYQNEGNKFNTYYSSLFGTNELKDGVLAPIAKNATEVNVAEVVAGLALQHSVDLTVDQTGATRTANVMGAYDFDPEATGVESVNDSNASLRSNGVKVLKDGRLVIEKGGKMFTVAGQQI